MKTKIIHTPNLKDIKTKKKQIVEKISIAVKTKLNKLLLEKGYTLTSLQNEIDKLISENDLKNFDYNTTMIKIEKHITEILSKLKPIEKKISSKTETKFFEEQPIDNRVVNTEPTQLPQPQQRPKSNIIIDKVEKLQNLRDKESSEWAVILKHNHKKFLEEEEERKRKDNEKRMEVKRMLDIQTKERYEQKQIQQKDLENFIKVQKAEIQTFENQEKTKKLEKIQKSYEQRKTQEKIIEEGKKQKENLQSEHHKIDLYMLDKARKDLKEEEDGKLKMKLEVREKFRKVIQENQEREALKKLAKENEKKENKRALEEYSKLIEKQDQDRKRNFQMRLEKINNNVANNSQLLEKQLLIKQRDEFKYQKEREEEDKM
jgi:hypothetical protein